MNYSHNLGQPQHFTKSPLSAGLLNHKEGLLMIGGRGLVLRVGWNYFSIFTHSLIDIKWFIPTQNHFL